MMSELGIWCLCFSASLIALILHDLINTLVTGGLDDG